VQSLERTAHRAGYDAQLIRAVNDINERQKSLLFEELRRYFGNRLGGATIALWGLAFKPNTDDMREAPSRNLMEALWSVEARVQAYDPVAMREAARLYPDEVDSGKLVLAPDAEAALSGADALVVCTEWREFQMPDYAEIRNRLSNPVIFDGRNILDPARAAQEGIGYYGIGVGDNGWHK
jgi:UDPglucose 6-dehydrogenase